ncbi:MAG: hypothetical protein ACOCX9_01880 [Spirochaetota bacterium]
MRRFIVFLFACGMLMQVSMSAAVASEKSFQGMVIYVNASEIEIKKGKKEMVFSFSPGIKVAGIEGEEASISALKPCQVVKVIYTIDQKKPVARLITVKKPADCINKK